MNNHFYKDARERASQAHRSGKKTERRKICESTRECVDEARSISS